MPIDPITQCNLSQSFYILFEHHDKQKMRIKVWEAKTLEDGKVLIRHGSLGSTFLKEEIKDRLYFEKVAPRKIAKGYYIRKFSLDNP